LRVSSTSLPVASLVFTANGKIHPTPPHFLVRLRPTVFDDKCGRVERYILVSAFLVEEWLLHDVLQGMVPSMAGFAFLHYPRSKEHPTL
jgi:hypothetical protein